MIEVQKRFLMRAIDQLTILGCKYAIQLPDGEIIGDLEVKVKKEPKPIKSGKPRNSYKHLGFKEKLVSVPMGEVAVFDIPEGCTITQLQGLITGLAGHAWGKGNYTSTQHNGQVQIMRIG